MTRNFGLKFTPYNNFNRNMVIEERLEKHYP